MNVDSRNAGRPSLYLGGLIALLCLLPIAESRAQAQSQSSPANRLQSPVASPIAVMGSSPIATFETFPRGARATGAHQPLQDPGCPPGIACPPGCDCPVGTCETGACLVPQACPPVGCPPMGQVVYPWRAQPGADEFLCDGDDRGEKVKVDPAFNVTGLGIEDTIGHYDTPAGRRLVSPSNRVCVYAPRFGAVRKVDGLISARLNQPVVAFEDKQQMVLTSSTDPSSTTKQNLAANRFLGSRRASGLLDRTRGVNADNTTQLEGLRNSFEAIQGTLLVQHGRFHRSQAGIIQAGIQSALAWETDLGLRVVAQGVQPIIVRDIKMAQELVSIESETGSGFRVTKMASRVSARAGEEVEFTIRFDNLTQETVGNVTLMDNLTRRLEYIEGSAECTVPAQFMHERNEDLSLLLRWEIQEPLEPGQGGVITFKCRAR